MLHKILLASCKNSLLALIAGSLVLTSCNSKCPPFEPTITLACPDSFIRSLPTPFEPLTKNELMSLWGKELYLGVCFAEEQDWYRAITAFKSSAFLIPKKEESRKQQIEFYLCLSYYLAGKLKDAYEVYENSSLIFLREDFPAKRELYIMLIDAYEKNCFIDKARGIQLELDNFDQGELSLRKALLEGDFCTLEMHQERPIIHSFLSEYSLNAKSVKKAEFLQTILPGAGYAYVGLKKTAMTSFIINALFIAAATEFWKRGYYAASLITWSLETGWYFGGINGAGLAANEYNERLYENLGKDVMVKEKLFPILRFEYAF